MGSSARDQIPGLQYASCEGDALLFTAGEGHDLVSRDMAESEPGEHGLGLALPDLFAVTGEAHAEGDVVKGAHVVVGGCGCGQAISWKTFRRDWRELASAGVDEGAEDATLVAIGALRELRMPLDGPDETLGRHPDRLHDAVRRSGHRFQSLAQRANRLMVITVDAQRIGARMIRPAEGIDLIGLRLTRAVVSQRPQRAGQRRIGRDRHFVDHRVIRRLVAMMHDRAGMFVRQILPQRATQGDVEALDAAADAQQWLVRRDDGGDQALLHPVAGLA